MFWVIVLRWISISNSLGTKGLWDELEAAMCRVTQNLTLSIGRLFVFLFYIGIRYWIVEEMRGLWDELETAMCRVRKSWKLWFLMNYWFFCSSPIFDPEFLDYGMNLRYERDSEPPSGVLQCWKLLAWSLFVIDSDSREMSNFMALARFHQATFLLSPLSWRSHLTCSLFGFVLRRNPLANPSGSMGISSIVVTPMFRV